MANMSANFRKENSQQDGNGSIDESSNHLSVGADMRQADEKNGPGIHSDSSVEQEHKSKSTDRLTIILTMFALCMSTFLYALDSTIITTALPTIASAFGTSSAIYTWIGSSYLLGAAAATPIWGNVSDIFGRKPILLAANALFFIGSLVCALAINPGMLLAGRVIQGVGGGGLTVMTQICIGDLFSMRNRAAFYGIVSMMWAFACAVGPVIGGALTQKVSWRWCFYINLPCDGAAFLVIIFFINIETPKTPVVRGLMAIDWLGALAMIGGTTMLLLGLNFGYVAVPWDSATVICLIIIGTLLLAAFFVIEAYIPKHPIMPLRIFSARNNIAALLTCFFQSLVFISGSYFLPLYFQDVFFTSPILSGVYLLPFVISLAMSAAATGILIRKTGHYRPFIWFGMATLTLGFGLFIDFPPYESWPRIIIFQIIAGIGTGPGFQGPLIALQARTQPQDVGAATATFLFARNLATAMSVVFGGAIFQNQLFKLAENSKDLTLPVKQMVTAHATNAQASFVKSLDTVERGALQSIYAMALRDMWSFFAAAAFVGFLASLLIQPKELSTVHIQQKQGLEAREEDHPKTAAEN